MVSRYSSETVSANVPQSPQISQVRGQRVAIVRLQRVILDDFFQLVDRAVQLPLVEMSPAQVAIELRQLSLNIAIAIPFFFLSSREIGSPPQIVLHPSPYVPRPPIFLTEDQHGRA